MNCLLKCYGCLTGCANKLQPVMLLLVRLSWGIQFFFAGKGKLENIQKPIEGFTQMHIPFPVFNAWLVGSVECFGGLLLILGLGSRLASLPLAFTMIVAYATAHRADLGSLEGIFNAPPFPFLIAMLVILAFGPGKISLDYLIEKKFLRRQAP